MTTRLLLAILASGMTGCASTTHHIPDAIETTLDTRVPLLLRQHDVPSLAIAYVRNGRIHWVRHFGEQAPGVPATDSTLYNIASLTKPIFAELVLQLASANRLSLDESIAPTWVDPDVAGDPRHALLTPRIALSHRTGFANWRRETDGRLRFKFDPGTAAGYSGEGFEYLSRFIQRKSAADIDSLAGKFVFEPFGMRSTSFVHRPWFEGRVALPRADGKYGKPDFQRAANAADDVYTTARDYAAFLVGVMNHQGLSRAIALQRDSVHIIDESPAAVCDSQKVARCPTKVGYGLGWSILEYPDETVLWHTGADWGEKSMTFYFANRREGVVLFANGANGFQVIADVAVAMLEGSDFGDYLRSKAGR